MDVQPPDKRTIFERALDFASGAEREAYLEDACAGKAEMRAQVDSLLKAHNDVGSFLDGPAFDAQRTAPMEPISEQPGTIIGPYKLFEQIGEGGFGVVYMAEQQQPVRRKVALKVVKPGMDSRQVLARFEAERQALAIMDHPNIAKVFDAGAIDSGRPYFVMELVKGEPITEFCDRNQLPPRERLELFGQVCHAVQHAHQKGIIHRDIKPTNVLVAMHDTTPVVKVIDFGIAKALGQELTDKTLFTGFAQFLGTPLYMSPEQAGESSLDVDTRSDIYSLGVLLYELLTGATPFDKERFRKAAHDEIRRIIREEEPPKPSTRLSESKELLPSISASRHTEPAKLTRLVRGELDWIVMKALEKDRNRRYETANGFVQDVQRYLADEPVQACPPSVGYHFRKFARRHQGGLAVAALVLFFLVLLGSGVGWAVRDRTARQTRIGAQVGLILGEVDRLEREQKWPEALAAARRAEAAAAGGEADAATAQRVRQRLKDLEFLDRLEQIRMRAATLVDREFDRAGADREYARAFRDYGVDVEALEVERSIDRLKARPELAIPLAAALDDWVAQRRVSAKDTADWKRLVAVARGIDPDPLRDRLRSTWGRPASETQDELRRLAESIDVRAQHPATLIRLSVNLLQVKDSDSALRVLRDAQYAYPGDFWLNFALGLALFEQKDHEGAVRFYTAAVSIRPRSSTVHNSLGLALYNQKKPDEAVAAYRKAIELDPKNAHAYTNLGIALRYQKKLDEAVAAQRKAIELDPKLAAAHSNLGNALFDQKKLHEAIACYKKAIELDPKDANAHNNLGAALYDQKKLDEAIAAYRKAIELDPKHANAHYGLGTVLSEQKQPDEAIAAYREAIDVDPKYALAYSNLGHALRDQKKLDEAVAAFRKAIELDPESAPRYSDLGYALGMQKKLDEAIACYKKAIELDPKSVSTYINLGFALRGQGDDPGAIAAYRKAIALNPDVASVHFELGRVLRGQGEFEALEELHLGYELGSKDPEQRDYSAKWLPTLARSYIHWRQKDKAAADYVMADLWARPTPEFLDQLNVQAYSLRRDGDLEQARELRARVVECAKTLLPAEDARRVKYQNDYFQLLLAMQRYEEAETVAGDALKSLPSEETTSRLMMLRSLANLYEQWNKPEEAERHRKLVISAEAAERAATMPMTSVTSEIDADREMRALDLNNRAWSLATSADPQTRDPHTAVELAQEAVKLAPNTADFWNTLGVAQYRDGNFEEAVFALQKYRDLRTTEAEWSNPFLLAMAHWQLGDKEARQWFDKGAQWMDAHNANSETMVRFRKEAAELLGVNEKK